MLTILILNITLSKKRQILSTEEHFCHFGDVGGWTNLNLNFRLHFSNLSKSLNVNSSQKLKKWSVLDAVSLNKKLILKFGIILIDQIYILYTYCNKLHNHNVKRFLLYTFTLCKMFLFLFSLVVKFISSHF